MIEISHLTKRYGEHLAVSDLSFTVDGGRIYGFLGPNGAGKSTTMNVIDEIPSFDHVTHLQFEGAEAYSITCQEDSMDSYNADDVYFTQRGGKTLPLDTSKVDSYLRSITNLNPIHYVSYNVTDEELQAYGLDAPALTITVEYTAKGEDGEEIADTFVLYVSPDPEDVKAAEEAEDGEEKEISAYIRIGESQIIYKVSSGSYKNVFAGKSDRRRVYRGAARTEGGDWPDHSSG